MTMAFHKLLDNCKFLSAFRAFKNRTVSAVGGSLPLAIHEPSFLGAKRADSSCVFMLPTTVRADHSRYSQGAALASFSC